MCSGSTPSSCRAALVADSIIGEYAGGGITDPGWQGPTPGAETLCGGDERVASTDNRVGRINGNCTGWLISNGGVLTAGHCGIAPGSIFEVNVPASQANGTTVGAAMRDQFPVLAGSITTINNGPGNDWTVCRLSTNNLGQYAHELHGFFRMARELPAVGQSLRITGCGVDVTPQGTQPTVCVAFNSQGTCTHSGPNAQNQTLQTSTGPFFGANGTALLYAVDTEPANSGSPIIWEGNEFTIGIHSFGGCTSDGGANSGTWFGLNTLENAIATVPGPNTRYLDTVNYPGAPADTGSIFAPDHSLRAAYDHVPNGGIISMVRGNYSRTAFGNTGTFGNDGKTVRLEAPVGPVTIGQ